MPEELPWELMRDSMRIFAHDSLLPYQAIGLNLKLISRLYPNPELVRLEDDIISAGNLLREIHGRFRKLRTAENPPPEKELAESIKQYRRLIRKANEKANNVFRRIKNFYGIHKSGMGEEARRHFESTFELIGQFKKQFHGDQLGRSIRVEAYNFDLRKFMEMHFTGKEFVDRDGRPVQVIVKTDKRVGRAMFDAQLLYRGIYNLVTDAYNHTPGRPIFITLKRQNGHVAINVTNQGRRLTPTEISKIGRVRFTRAMHDPSRGYGKISTRLLTEAQGGTFRAGNSRIGPMLSIRLPLRRMRA